MQAAISQRLHFLAAHSGASSHALVMNQTYFPPELPLLPELPTGDQLYTDVATRCEEIATDALQMLCAALATYTARRLDYSNRSQTYLQQRRELQPPESVQLNDESLQRCGLSVSSVSANEVAIQRLVLLRSQLVDSYLKAWKALDLVCAAHDAWTILDVSVRRFEIRALQRLASCICSLPGQRDMELLRRRRRND